MSIIMTVTRLEGVGGDVDERDQTLQAIESLLGE